MAKMQRIIDQLNDDKKALKLQIKGFRDDKLDQ